ncbi:hypothetical protein V8E36_002605 [Tilletia maclaganii]
MPPKRPAPLPTKERVLFANLLQDYEKRTYKLGIMTADTILKKFPDHGETLAMKGLLLASLNRKQEGLELAKKGLRFDLGSFICWHALGIIYRMDRNYQEAIKSYTRALNMEGGNINLLRELAFMHMQERNFGPLIDHRLTLLRVQPHYRTTWIALALAHHAAGSLEDAIRVVESFKAIFRYVPKRNYEQSEVRLYLASLYEEAGRSKDVVTYLSRFSDDEMVDYAPRYEILGTCMQTTASIIIPTDSLQQHGQLLSTDIEGFFRMSVKSAPSPILQHPPSSMSVQTAATFFSGGGPHARLDPAAIASHPVRKQIIPGSPMPPSSYLVPDDF